MRVGRGCVCSSLERGEMGGGWANLYCEIKNLNSIYIFQCTVYGVIIQTKPTTWTFFIYIHLLSFRQTPPHGPFLFTYIYYYIIRTNPTTLTFFYLHTFITSFRQTPPHGPFLFIISFTNYAITNISKLFFDTHKMAFFCFHTLQYTFVYLNFDHYVQWMCLWI